MIEWFNVDDKLPPTFSIDDRDKPLSNGGTSEDVLIFDGENIGIGYYEAEYFIDDDPLAFEGQSEIYSSPVWHSDNHMLTSIGGFPIVTHWALFPKPPFPPCENSP